MATDPFVVALGDLRDHRGTRHVVRRARLGAPLVADVDSRAPAGAEVVADVVLEAFDGGVAVSGMVSSQWEGECRRCLRGIGGDVSTEVKEIFRRGGGPDEGTYALGEESLNLREMVLDCLFSALPLLPLCREACLGICPSCGADRNVAPCGCGDGEGDPRWSVLDVLEHGPYEP